MNKRLKFSTILPSLATLMSFLILPLILTVYFIFTRYSDKFINTQGIDYFAIQDNVLATFFISGQLNEWLTRFMDFAFWGVIASIVILIGWLVSVARTSVENHATEQQFSNFNISKQSWHGTFAVVAIIKTILVFLMVFAVFQLIARAIPQLATGVAKCIQELSWDNLQLALWGGALVIGTQLLLVTAIKLFRVTRAE